MMSREKTFIIVLDDLPAKLSYANYGNININTPEPLFTNHSRTREHTNMLEWFLPSHFNDILFPISLVQS